MDSMVLHSVDNFDADLTYVSSQRSMRSSCSLKWRAVARKVGESSAASLIVTGLQ